MRLLHTSDWHLGRSFHRADLLGTQAAFADFLIETVRSERIDAVLVSGDLFDRALPPVEAVTLAGEVLARLVDAGARVVVISGNHDSARRLGFAADLISAGGVHLRTNPATVDRPVLLEDADGPVAVYALPYLEPGVVANELAAETRSHDAVLGAAMARVRTDLRARRARSVVLAHAFVNGGEASDSERDISVGGVAVVPTNVFEGIDYVALGHLHGRQTLTPTMRYSGSPLAYSFSEATHTKGCWIVDLDDRGTVDVTPVDAPVPRRVGRLRGRLDDLLTAAEFSSYEEHWLHVTLFDSERPIEPMERLRARFPHTLVLAFEPETATEHGGTSYGARLRGRSDLDVATDFVAHVRGRTATDAERALLDEAFAVVRAAEVAV